MKQEKDKGFKTSDYEVWINENDSPTLGVEANQIHKLLAIFFFPFLLFIKLISPVYKIRLNILISARIGHFAESAGLSLCEKIQGEKYKDIFWFRCPSL